MHTSRLTWAIITGEYPPQPGGVSDYTQRVARELARAGDDVHVWAPSYGSPDTRDDGVVVHRLQYGFGLRGLGQLGREIARLKRPRRILVQYVPHAFGFKALNVLFPAWLNSLRKEHVQMMFHEVAFPFVRGQPLRHHLLAWTTRLMALLAVRGVREVFVSVPAWSDLLRRLGSKRPSPVWLPVPCNLPDTVSAQAVAAARSRVGATGDTTIIGHFGTYGAHQKETLTSVLPGLLSRNGDCIALLLGRGSEQFADEVTGNFATLNGHVHATGELPPEQLAAYLAACDVLIQPYPDGVSSRRTTVMAGLALGLPIVTTEGFLTEPIWRQTNAVELAPATSPAKLAAGAEALLADPLRRVELGSRAKSVYATTFAVERTIQALRSHDPQPRTLEGNMSGSLLASFVGKLPGSCIAAVSRLRWRHPALQGLFEWCADRLRNQDGRIQQGAGKGLRFNTGSANAGYLLGTSEPAVQRAMVALVQRGMTVFDIGANVGFHSVIAARLTGSTGKVVSFEPLPANAEQIKHNASLNGFHWIEVREEALGKSDARSTFLVSAEPAWGRLQAGDATVNRHVATITVAVRSLDNLIANGLPRPDLIKMDVEGGEVDVLAGACNMLRKDRPILMIELHGTNSAVAKRLLSLGYRGFVLGRDCTIEEAPWDAFVVAAPDDKPEVVEAAERSSQVAGSQILS